MNDSTIVGCTGDYADFQWLREVIEQKQIDEEVSGHGDCETTKPSALYHWLTRFLYNRRSKFDPLWTTVVVGGIQDGAPFLGCVNYIGVAYQENAISTGLGQDIAVPIMRYLHRRIGIDENSCAVQKTRSTQMMAGSAMQCWLLGFEHFGDMQSFSSDKTSKKFRNFWKNSDCFPGSDGNF